MNIETWMDSAREIAAFAGTELLKYWGALKAIEHKSAYWDIVTEADVAAEKVILNHLNARFPDHNILTEESGLIQKSNSDLWWVIDPLDGTTNFSHNFPFFAVSIGLRKGKDMLVGAIYDPFHQEMFLAGKGKGAFLNNSPIHVSSNNHFTRCLLATGLTHEPINAANPSYKEFCHFTSQTQGVRRLGSAALDLAYVACGRLDGYWERDLKAWNIAAGSLLVNEAGGITSDFEGNPLAIEHGDIIASNRFIHDQIRRELTIALN
jgi:myo-inositol-1(or 4)-monophosphatase